MPKADYKASGDEGVLTSSPLPGSLRKPTSHGHVVSLETGAMWGAAAREVVVFLQWGCGRRGGVDHEGGGRLVVSVIGT